ncbi:MAG: hypothetical protein LC725_09650 [Lentisphaerae bacterium]|nr:hypothetical protein [Lentisphaerota bacterium]
MPPSSNIVRFSRQFYLYPLPDGDDRQTMERVCGRVYDRPADMPRGTSLQRVVAGHMERGGRWYQTGGFLLREDVSRWGTDYYRG